jgi:hypothetical protein
MLEIIFFKKLVFLGVLVGISGEGESSATHFNRKGSGCAGGVQL